MQLSDPGIRVLVIAGVLLVVAIAAWSAGRNRKVRPLRAIRDDLPPGVHLFTSSTCAACAEARKVIVSVYGSDFTEIRHEDDPSAFGHHRIARAPTTIVVFGENRALMFEGVPRRRQLPLPGTLTSSIP